MEIVIAVFVSWYIMAFLIIWAAMYGDDNDNEIPISSLIYCITPVLNTAVFVALLLSVIIKIDLPEFGYGEKYYRITRKFFLKKC